MIASLMMYLRPETAAATARYWALIRDGLRARGVAAPEGLDNAREEFAVWKAPDLTLSQTCGMPYRLWLHDRVTLIGTPDFAVEGCPPGYYHSVFVVRANDPRETISEFRAARFTYNQTSQGPRSHQTPKLIVSKPTSFGRFLIYCWLFLRCTDMRS
mgnify:CR=1 FL=1